MTRACRRARTVAPGALPAATGKDDALHRYPVLKVENGQIRAQPTSPR